MCLKDLTDNIDQILTKTFATLSAPLNTTTIYLRTVAASAAIAGLSIIVAFVGSMLFTPLPVQAAHSHGLSTTQDASRNFKQGENYYYSGDFDRAIDSLLQAVYFARNNYYPDAYFYLGLAYKSKHQDPKAIEAFGKCIEQALGPAPEAHLELGKVLMRDNRDVGAAQEFSKASTGSTMPEAQNALGLLAEKRNDALSAESNFIAALGDRPWKYTKAWMNFAELMMKEQKWGDALSNFQQMLDRHSSLKDLDESRVHFDMGLCLVSKGDHQGALEEWRYASSLKPDWCLPHLLLGQMFEKESHLRSAVTEYRDYLRLAPDNDKNIPAVKDRLVVLEQQVGSDKSQSEHETDSADGTGFGAGAGAGRRSHRKGTQPSTSNGTLAPLPDTGF